MNCAFILSVGAFVAFATVTSGQVTGASLSYFAQYDQNTDSYDDAIFEADLYTTNPGDINGASITFSDNGTGSLQAISTATGTDWFYSHSNNDVYDLEYLFPSGTYTINTTGGTVGSQNYSLTANGELPTEQLFTATTIYDLSHQSTAAPITVTFQPFASDPNANVATLYLLLYGNGIYNTYNLSPSATQFTVPANTLAPDKTYTFELYEDNEYLSDAPAGSSSYNSYESQTTLSFVTSAAPEPSTFALVTLGIAGLLFVGRLPSRHSWPYSFSFWRAH